MENQWKEKFQQHLLTWYQSQQRSLPWREHRDPYPIWISEIMLQQTKVETVLPYFQRFITAFPTIEALAAAPQDDVLKYWEGLGYYSRARHLHQAAQMIVKEMDGVFPNEINELRRLPGVGPYTAGAIMSIAYNQPEPAVDGNVKRVFSRLFTIDKDVKSAKTKKYIESLAREAIPAGQAADFNQALMELGALICLPSSPQCQICPVQKHCSAYARGDVEIYPIRTKKKRPKSLVRLILIVRRKDQILLVQNPNSGMLAGLWAFPGLELTLEEWATTRMMSSAQTKAGEQLALLSFAKTDSTAWANIQTKLKDHLKKTLDLTVQVDGIIGETQHTFTHRHWKMPIIACDVIQQMDHITNESPTWAWVRPHQFSDYAIPTVYQKVIKEIRKSPAEN